MNCRGENEKSMESAKTKLGLSVLAWSIFIFVYWILFYELYTLCQFGRIHNNITVLLLCMVILLAWFIFFIFRKVRKQSIISKENVEGYSFYSQYKIIRNFIVILSIVFITGFYGAKIYHSAINYNGKLSWFLADLKNKKSVKLEHSNIYESGIEGILLDINKKIHMPEKLYIANNFSLNFDSNGKITAFDAFLYGKNDKGKTESYLINYSSKSLNNIIVRLNGYVNASFSDDKLLEPLINTVKVIPLKKTVSSWPDDKYGILYSGKRSFGYNTNGIVYIDSKGNANPAAEARSEITGYFVSVYVPGKENLYTPVRYSLIGNLNNTKTAELSKDNKKSSGQSNNTAEQFFLSKQLGYRLEVTDAAAGSRAYSLTGTTDGGTTWKTINKDPFSGSLGVAAGITFLNDKLGFLCLSSSGGIKGQLYQTEDGGVSYRKVNIPGVKVTLSNGETYNPFDLPGMPYEKDGTLNVLVGQGADGDYNGGCKALYQSKDNGLTWEFIEESAKG